MGRAVSCTMSLKLAFFRPFQTDAGQGNQEGACRGHAIAGHGQL